MTNYQNGKIYKIEALNGEEGDVYIGSTCKQYLSQRMDKHREMYRYWKKGNKGCNMTSYILFEKYGIENCIIVLIETSPCNKRDELFSREAYHIKSMKCVNKSIPLRTGKEYREDNKDKICDYKKEYYEENKEKISDEQKEYYENNREERLIYKNIYYHSNQDKITELGKKYYNEHKDEIKDYGKSYYQENKEKIDERNKLYTEKNVEAITLYKTQWYEDNKVKIQEKNKEKVPCECGSVFRRNGISEHNRSKKHIAYLESLNL
jgi:hypothetical protein